MANVAAKLDKNLEVASRFNDLLTIINNSGARGSHELLFEIAKALGFKGGSRSRSNYIHFGNGISIRIANHFATVRNFLLHSHPHNNFGIVIKLSKNNKLVILDLDKKKGNIEIVHWYRVNSKGLEQIKRQAEREGGQILMLPSENSEEAGVLSSRTLGKPLDRKGNALLSDKQVFVSESSDPELEFRDADQDEWHVPCGDTAVRFTFPDTRSRSA